MIYAAALTLVLSQETHTIAISVQPNDRFEYKLEFKVEAVSENTSVDVKTRFAERVVSASSKSVVFSTYFLVDDVKAVGPLQAAANTFSDMHKQVFLFDRNIQNALLSTTYQGVKMDGSATTNTSDVTYPERPIKIGDQWPQTKILNGGVKIDFTNELKGVTQWKGVEAWHIVALPAKSEVVATPTPFEYYIEKSSGRMIFSKGSLTMAIPQAPMPLTVSYQLERTKTMLAPRK